LRATVGYWITLILVGISDFGVKAKNCFLLVVESTVVTELSWLGDLQGAYTELLVMMRIFNGRMC
jgi:hypothetical protein